MIHAGKVLTHKHLLREVWRDESVDPQYLRVYVRQLRQKIEADPSTPRHVLTEPGVGYRLVLGRAAGGMAACRMGAASPLFPRPGGSSSGRARACGRPRG